MLLRAWLVDHGWQLCVSDPCIYISRAGHVFAMIALYVDDIPAACNDATWLISFKAQLGSEKTKHIGVKWHFLKDHVEQGTIKLRYLPSSQMVADMFTKPLP
jgi:hypothetical protein